MRISTGVIAIVAFASAAAAQVSPRQKAYNAAQAAFDAGNWQAAADGYAPLLADDRHPARTDGIIRARYAASLFQLDRAEEAEAQAQRAAAEFPAGGPDEERASAFLTLGRVRAATLALAAASDAYEHAGAAVAPGSALWLQARLGLVRAALTVDPSRADAAASDIIANTAVFGAMAKNQQGQITAYRALAKLNGGDAKGALTIMRQALADVGGIGCDRVNLIQAIVRGDAALVMLRAGREDEARTALAHAGSGYMPSSDWLGDQTNELPVCDDDVRPEDVAVVEFDVGDDGRVTSAFPIFASRTGRVGATFAAKVLGWRFAAEQMAKVKPFWRSAVRLELRCVTRPASLTLGRAFDDAAIRWFEARGLTHSGSRADLTSVAAGASASRDVATLADVLRRSRDRLGRGDRRVLPQELFDALKAAGAPADVRAAFAYRDVRYGTTLIGSASSRGLAFSRLADTFSAMPDGAAAAAWFDVEAALAMETSGNFTDARTRLDRALATSIEAVPANDPIRVVATLHRALVDRRLGDAAAADARLRTAGLDAEQCSLFDVRPLP